MSRNPHCKQFGNSLLNYKTFLKPHKIKYDILQFKQLMQMSTQVRANTLAQSSHKTEDDFTVFNCFHDHQQDLMAFPGLIYTITAAVVL